MFAGRFSLYPPDKIVVLTQSMEGSDAFDQRQKYKIVRVPINYCKIKGFEWLGGVWDIFKVGVWLCLRENIKIIQCARPIPEGLAGYLISRILFRKLIVNFHGEDISVLQNYRVERLLLKRIISSASLNLANSQFTANLVRNLGGRKASIFISRPGFTPEMTSSCSEELLREIRNKISGTPVLLTIGRFQRRKGQDQVIRALPKLMRFYPDIKYVMVGATHGGTEGFVEYLHDLASELNIEKNIFIAGEVSSKQISAYLELCDIFVMPNRVDGPGDVEGFGIVFLEASAKGKPVIGGKSGGVPDAIKDGETGFLVDGQSVDEIVKAIDHILSNKKLASELGCNGIEFAKRMTDKQVFMQLENKFIELDL